MAHQILPRLWVGNFEDAEVATPALFSAILTLSERKPLIQEHIEHIHAPIPDEVYLPGEVWAELVHATRQLVSGQQGNVLIHCRLGVSRSPALCAAYMAAHGWTLEEAISLIMCHRPIVKVHQDTWRGVLDWWEKR